MTFDRTVVAGADEPVALRVLAHSGRAAVSVDGQLRGVLDPGDWIGVFAAPRPLRLVRLKPADFYGRLRERLRLTDAPATAADGEAAPFFRPSSPVPADLAHLHLPPPVED
jgi:NAD+ kinase